jgi:cysteine desulfurase
MRGAGIYFDENSTATPYKRAIEAASTWLSRGPANGSSVHALGRDARGAIERSRRQVAQSLGVNPRHLTFTSGATEGLHTVIMGVTRPGDHVIVSAVEHPAVWGALERAEVEYTVIPVDRRGWVHPQSFSESLQPHTRLAIMMLAQNEVGVSYPIAEIAAQLGEVPLLCDAVQAWGKMPLHLEKTGATFSILSGHKIGAPIGTGVIWARGGAPFMPLLKGGAQERGRRAGTENTPSIVGLGVAAEHIQARLDQISRVGRLRDQLQEQITSELSSDVEVHCAEEIEDPCSTLSYSAHGRLYNTLSLGMRAIEGDLILQSLDLEGIYISAGSACSSGALEPSPVLLALGLDEAQARRGIRISLGPQTQEAEVQKFYACFKATISQLR